MTGTSPTQGFPDGSDGKESACNAGDLGSIPGSEKSPGEGNGNPPQYSCLENSMDKRTMAGYSPWGHKGSDMTEKLNMHTHNHILRPTICKTGILFLTVFRGR